MEVGLRKGLTENTRAVFPCEFSNVLLKITGVTLTGILCFLNVFQMLSVFQQVQVDPRFDNL